VDDPVAVEIEIELAPDPPRCEVSAPAAPADVRDRRRVCNEIMSDYLTHRDKDPFDFLGVSSDASSELIRTKYIELCKKYAPWRFEAAPFQAVSEKADELLRAAIFAFSELRDEKRRKELLAQRGERTPKRGQILPSSHFANAAEELAETYCQRGYELLATGNFGAASDLFSLALGSDPENRAYLVELAYAHFRDSPKNAGQVLKELNAVLSQDPGCVQAYLYAAEITHALGELERAEAYFLRGCEAGAGGA
jgi:tetratricopeptide (TPR) repeat protein